MKKETPQVDEADVNNMVDFIFGRGFNSKLSAEERADAAYIATLNLALLRDSSRPYAELLAEKVRAKALWLQGPTGRIVDMP